MSRHNARELALQMIFQMDVGGNTIDIAEMTLSEAELDPDKKDFTRTLVVGVQQNVEDLDTVIGKYSKDWKVSRLANVDRAILRLAAFELLHTSTPPDVVVNEAIELTKHFSSDEAPAFVNGILNALWHGELDGKEEE